MQNAVEYVSNKHTNRCGLNVSLFQVTKLRFLFFSNENHPQPLFNITYHGSKSSLHSISYATNIYCVHVTIVQFKLKHHLCFLLLQEKGQIRSGRFKIGQTTSGAPLYEINHIDWQGFSEHPTHSDVDSITGAAIIWGYCYLVNCLVNPKQLF